MVLHSPSHTSLLLLFNDIADCNHSMKFLPFNLEVMIWRVEFSLEMEAWLANDALIKIIDLDVLDMNHNGRSDNLVI